MEWVSNLPRVRVACARIHGEQNSGEDARTRARRLIRVPGAARQGLYAPGQVLVPADHDMQGADADVSVHPRILIALGEPTVKLLR